MQQGTITIDGQDVPVHYLNTVVLGAGAAGMSCVLHLWDFYTQMGLADAAERVACVTTGLPLGASRMSGSDKQTYYKMGTSPSIPDTAVDFAKTLIGGGCMHGDHALIEGAASLRQFYRLVDAGVPFPHDPEGAFIGYKTDHDPYERATSAGPKTSKFMSECLEARVRRAGITIFDKHELVELLRNEQGRVVALLTIDKARAAAGNDNGLTLFAAANVVLATGGPGQIYQVTVYPRGQVGIHGIAYRAGLKASNLTESQYGLASTSFRWNVSGTYMQVVPRIFSTAADGSDPREFLTEYFPTMEQMATAIFLKGYQWPFDAQRIDQHQSSLVDMAVHTEIFTRGRRVFMDFLQNPIGSASMKPFAIADLHEEARVYLERTGALQGLPIERLVHMNQPAIDIYTENGIDLHSEPLEIAVCAQHMNGGLSVDRWWQTNLPHVFAIGETAGTHGVKRPGGSALNAGQAGALRSAEYIARVHGPEVINADMLDTTVLATTRDIARRLAGWVNGDGLDPAAVMDELCTRMSLRGAHIRDSSTIGAALAEAVAQYRAVTAKGLRVSSTAGLAEAVQAESQCLAHVAQLYAIAELIGRGLGSRGSYVVLDPEGLPMAAELADPDSGDVPRWRPENPDLKATVQEVRFDPEAPELFQAEAIPCRPMPERDVAFEPMWTAYRAGDIFRD